MFLHLLRASVGLLAVFHLGCGSDPPAPVISSCELDGEGTFSITRFDDDREEAEKDAHVGVGTYECTSGMGVDDSARRVEFRHGSMQLVLEVDESDSEIGLRESQEWSTQDTVSPGQIRMQLSTLHQGTDPEWSKKWATEWSYESGDSDTTHGQWEIIENGDGPGATFQVELRNVNLWGGCATVSWSTKEVPPGENSASCTPTTVSMDGRITARYRE